MNIPSAALFICVITATQHAHAAPPITAAAFAPDGHFVVVGSQSGIEVYKWPNLESARRIKTSLAHVHDLAFSPDGKSLAAAGGAPAEEGGFEIFSWPDGQRTRRVQSLGDVVYQLAWIGDDRLALAGEAGDVIISDLKGDSLQRLKGHSRGVLAIAVLPDGKQLVSGSVDQSVRVWDVETGELVRTLSNHTAAVRDVAVRTAGEGLPLIATAGADKTVRFWQPTIGRMVRFARLESAPLTIAWSPDGARLAVTCENGHLRIIDPETTDVIKDAPAVDGWAYTVAASPRGNDMLVAGEGGQLRRVE